MGITIKKMASGVVIMSGEVPHGKLRVDLNCFDTSAPAGVFDYTEEEQSRFDAILQRFFDDIEVFWADVEKRISDNN